MKHNAAHVCTTSAEHEQQIRMAGWLLAGQQDGQKVFRFAALPYDLTPMTTCDTRDGLLRRTDLLDE